MNPTSTATPERSESGTLAGTGLGDPQKGFILNRGSWLYRVDITQAPDPLITPGPSNGFFFFFKPSDCPEPPGSQGYRVCDVALDSKGLEIFRSGKGEFFCSSTWPGKAAVGALLIFRAPAGPRGSHPSCQPQSPPGALHLP